LTDTEQRAAAATHVALTRRKMRRPRRCQASRSKAIGTEGTASFRVEAT
jgi:hypothetical protein